MAASKRKTSKSKRRWVIKAGSQMVCGGGPLLLRAWMAQVAELKRRHNIEVIWVTSGAIASAKDRTMFVKHDGTLPDKQALSAIGQPMVMDLYNLALNASGLLGAQVLLTAGDIRAKDRRQNLQNTLERLLLWEAVPVLNENDAVATAEIKFGDNDSLSSQIARMMKAEHLVLLTDVDGLYEQDPRTHPEARRIDALDTVRAADLKRAGHASAGGRGTGGMYSKLLAAREALKDGITTHLVRGDSPSNLIRLALGESLGTRIGPTLAGSPR